jgi:hypothetical protein
MPNSFRRSVFAGTGLLVSALLLCLLCLPASQALGQDVVPPTTLQKQLDRMDLAVSAAGIVSSNVSGNEQLHPATMLTISPSSTVGELVTLRYIAKPLVGFEFNFGNSRYTQNYAFSTTPAPLLGAQAGVREMTLGYVAHLPYHPFGITPYLGAGGGTIKFTPTPYGGEGLPFQYRAVYYYSLGVEQNFPSSHFGVRLGFRQLIYLAPDFQQNYLTITRRTVTSEPTFGLFVRF